MITFKNLVVGIYGYLMFFVYESLKQRQNNRLVFTATGLVFLFV